MGRLSRMYPQIGVVIGFVLDLGRHRENAKLRLARGGDGKEYAVWVDRKGNIL
jgi:hypothetical protein